MTGRSFDDAEADYRAIFDTANDAIFVQMVALAQATSALASQDPAGCALRDRRPGADCHGRSAAVADRPAEPVPPEIRDRIFMPFFTTKPRGTGLGLSTAKRLVDIHHGRIGVECPPEGGTIVTIALPQAQRVASSA